MTVRVLIIVTVRVLVIVAVRVLVIVAVRVLVMPAHQASLRAFAVAVACEMGMRLWRQTLALRMGGSCSSVHMAQVDSPVGVLIVMPAHHALA